MAQRHLILLTDIGDTVIDEESENHPYGTELVLSARCIPGAREAYLKLHEEGFVIAMVADGLSRSFHNTMRQHGLDHIFSAWINSEQMGCSKPDVRMFEAAFRALNLRDEDKERVLMVGNNVKRDILGASRFGIRSILMDWSRRRPYDAEQEGEIPTYRIHTPSELPVLMMELEAAWVRGHRG